MNMVVKTPRENSYIGGVPFYWNPFLPTSEKISMHDLPASSWYKDYSEGDDSFFDTTVPYTSAPIIGGLYRAIYPQVIHVQNETRNSSLGCSVSGVSRIMNRGGP